MKPDDIDAEIALLARELKTPVITSTFHALAEQAREQAWSHETYLAAVLARQVASRTINGARLRIAGARFPQTKTLEDFTFAHLPTAARDTLSHLATTTFIGRRENAVLLGPPGLGKTHLAIAIGINTMVRVSNCEVIDSNRFVWAYSTASSKARMEMPQARAATLTRPTSTPSIMWAKPRPGSPPRMSAALAW